MAPTFILIRTTDLNTAQEEVRKAFAQIGAIAVGKLFEGVSVGVASTPIPHALGSKPTSCLVLPRSDARVWRSQAPDATNVYLQASSATSVDLWIF